jgi:hypothetical protein
VQGAVPFKLNADNSFLHTWDARNNVGGSSGSTAAGLSKDGTANHDSKDDHFWHSTFDRYNRYCHESSNNYSYHTATGRYIGSAQQAYFLYPLANRLKYMHMHAVNNRVVFQKSFLPFFPPLVQFQSKASSSSSSISAPMSMMERQAMKMSEIVQRSSIFSHSSSSSPHQPGHHLNVSSTTKHGQDALDDSDSDINQGLSHRIPTPHPLPLDEHSHPNTHVVERIGDLNNSQSLTLLQASALSAMDRQHMQLVQQKLKNDLSLCKTHKPLVTIDNVSSTSSYQTTVLLHIILSLTQ